MASFMTKMKSTVSHLPHGTASRGFKGIVVDKGERYLGAFGVGAAKGYYGERFIWKGHGLDLWGGVALTLGAAVAQAFSGGHSSLAPHMERLGDVGVMSALGSLGASFGLAKAGRSVAVLNPGKNTKGALPRQQQVVGQIPQARGGAFLSADEIANFANRR